MTAYETMQYDAVVRRTVLGRANGTSTLYAYDTRGNLTGAGSAGYAYKADGSPQSSSASSWYYYDAAGRLDYDPTAGQAFDYVGSALIAERDINSNALLRRYVYGPDPDEPLIWYEGSGTRTGATSRRTSAAR